jgi:streptomycin 6-kinase
MSTLDSYLQKWQLCEAELIAETATSFVYKVRYASKLAVLKILTPVGRKCEANGAQALKCFDGKGAARAYEWDEEALLMEFVEGQALSALVNEGRDLQATKHICDVLGELHSFSGPTPTGLHNLNRQFQSLFKRAQVADAS